MSGAGQPLDERQLNIVASVGEIMRLFPNADFDTTKSSVTAIGFDQTVEALRVAALSSPPRVVAADAPYVPEAPLAPSLSTPDDSTSGSNASVSDEYADNVPGELRHKEAEGARFLPLLAPETLRASPVLRQMAAFIGWVAPCLSVYSYLKEAKAWWCEAVRRIEESGLGPRVDAKDLPLMSHTLGPLVKEVDGEDVGVDVLCGAFCR